MVDKKRMKRHIALTGVEKKQKQVAKQLADMLEMMVFDCEGYICFNNAMSVQQLIKKANVTYFKKQVSKSIRELDDLQNMVFVSCDQHLLSVGDLQKLNEYCYVIYLFDSANVAKKGEISNVADEKFLQLCVSAHKRYRSRCDFALDTSGLDENQTANKICEWLQTLV